MSTSVGQDRQGQNWCSLSTNVSNYKCVFFCNQTTICVEDSATNEASQYYLDVMTNRFFDPLYHHVAGWFCYSELRWWNFRNHWITFKLWPSLKIQSAERNVRWNINVDLLTVLVHTYLQTIQTKLLITSKMVGGRLWFLYVGMFRGKRRLVFIFGVIWAQR